MIEQLEMIYEHLLEEGSSATLALRLVIEQMKKGGSQ